ncbi:hypothetical protein CSIM01_05936 [Colletotrichum simmondsii]|uniref:Uncharacterized protein n=1 Tax=Colletotrichum simmondsii TaxID=703756 RepID=A0A135T3U3_9PEZI|nr:hypothetical protein CSIM01_05936 [Colletotrichum simmondsii]
MALPITLLALLTTLLTTAHALNVTVPSEIKAGVETEIEIGFDYWKQRFVYETLPGPVFDEIVAVCRNPVDEDVGCGHDMLYEHYQLFLYTEEWMYTCYLSDFIPMGTANPKITIPKDLGPSESYKITAMAFNGSKIQTNYYGVESSPDFTLTNTDIKDWTAWESYGGWLKPWHSLPCSSYGCYRTCGLKFADEHGNKKQGTGAGLFNCLNECPGILADWNDPDSQWSWYKAFDGHDWSGESTAVTTSTPSAVPSTTGYGVFVGESLDGEADCDKTGFGGEEDCETSGGGAEEDELRGTHGDDDFDVPRCFWRWFCAWMDLAGCIEARWMNVVVHVKCRAT